MTSTSTIVTTPTGPDAPRNVAIVDGSNVAHSTEGEPPHVENLLIVRDTPMEEGLEPIILAFARELKASIVSNDRFRDRIKQFPEAKDRVIRYMILNHEVAFERRTQRRHGE